MSTQEEARQKMAQFRHEDEHLKETMHSRSEEKLNRPHNSNIDEEARESMLEQRKQDQHLKQSMLSRSEEEIGFDKNR